MNRAITLCSIALTATLAAYGQAPSTPTKIGIINIQQAIIQTRDGQAAAKQLDAKSAPKKKELEAMQAEIRGMQDKLSKMSSVGSEEQKQALMRDIDTRTKQFNRSVEDAQAELDGEQQKVLNELGGKMLAVLDKYGKDHGYAIIFDVSQQTSNVLFAANGIDITKEVIELYDKNAGPATTSAPPAASGGGAAAKPAAPKPAPAK
jgi:outer membrane protein